MAAVTEKREKPDFAEVYEQEYSYVYNYVYMQVMHRENTEDLVSDVFIRAMAHYSGFDPAKASVRTWLCTIARNCLIDYYRKNGRRKTENLDDAPGQQGSLSSPAASLRGREGASEHDLCAGTQEPADRGDPGDQRESGQRKAQAPSREAPRDGEGQGQRRFSGLFVRTRAIPGIKNGLRRTGSSRSFTARFRSCSAVVRRVSCGSSDGSPRLRIDS